MRKAEVLFLLLYPKCRGSNLPLPPLHRKNLCISDIRNAEVFCFYCSLNAEILISLPPRIQPLKPLYFRYEKRRGFYFYRSLNAEVPIHPPPRPLPLEPLHFRYEKCRDSYSPPHCKNLCTSHMKNAEVLNPPPPSPKR